MTSQPSASFVPLTAASAAPGAREFRVTVLNGHGTNGHSESNGHGNGNGQVKANGTEKKAGFQSLESLRPAPLNGGEQKTCEPRVTVQRDGKRVTHLRIQCTCGQIMDLACVYEETPPAA